MISSRLPRPSQSGMVSIMVTMIMMLVISLIVLGFAQVSRREQRQTLDRQLSSQAFFAAESAVNDARNVITTALASGQQIVEKDSCPTSPAGPDYRFDPKIDSANNVSYTCLLVTTQLDNLQADVTAGGDATTLPLEIDDASHMIRRLHLKWTSPVLLPVANPTTVNNNCSRANGRFVPVTSWTCPYGVVRMDLVPTDSLDRAAVTAGQKTYFFYPRASAVAASVNYGTTPSGTVAAMQCISSGISCDIDINGIAGSQKFAMRISAMYANGHANITAFDDPVQLLLKNAQVQIDATGKAKDVLRRIQVRLALAKPAANPGYALESASSLCKRFTTSAGTFTIPNFAKAQDQKNPMCRPISIPPPPPPVTPPPPPPPPCVVRSDIALALDTSKSMNVDWGQGLTRRQKLNQVAQRFIRNTTVGPTTNHEAIIGFSGEGNPITEFIPLTGSEQTLLNGFPLPSVYGTDYLPALNKAGTELNSARHRAGAPRVLIFISDGEADNETDAQVWTRTDAMRRNGIIIYTIGIGDDTNFRTLQGMVVKGNFTSAKDPAALDDIIDKLAKGLNCGN